MRWLANLLWAALERLDSALDAPPIDDGMCDTCNVAACTHLRPWA